MFIRLGRCLFAEPDVKKYELDKDIDETNCAGFKDVKWYNLFKERKS